jgi:hypothetical protein
MTDDHTVCVLTTTPNYYPVLMKKHSHHSRWTHTSTYKYKHSWLPYGHQHTDEFYDFDSDPLATASEVYIPVSVFSDGVDHIGLVTQAATAQAKVTLYRRSFYELESELITLALSYISGYKLQAVTCYWGLIPLVVGVLQNTSTKKLYLKIWQMTAGTSGYTAASINSVDDSTNDLIELVGLTPTYTGAVVDIAVKNTGYASTDTETIFYVSHFLGTTTLIYKFPVKTSYLTGGFPTGYGTILADDITTMTLSIGGGKALPECISYVESTGNLKGVATTAKEIVDFPFSSGAVATNATGFTNYGHIVATGASPPTIKPMIASGFDVPFLHTAELEKGVVGAAKYMKAAERARGMA